MKQKRKGITRPKNKAFHKEYSFEIKVIILFTLGIFLLVEDLEIKHYIYEFIRTVLFTIGNGIKIIRDLAIFLIKQFEVSDIVGISLILYVMFLIANRWRERMIDRHTNLTSCMQCGGDIKRVRKNLKHKAMGILYFVSVKHYQCKNCMHKDIKLIK